MKTPRLILSNAITLTLATGAIALAQPLSPAPTLNPSASQTPNLDAMRPEVDAALRKLSAVQQNLRTKYESSEDYTAIRKELEAAKKEYDAARAKALAKLKDNDEYKRASEDARVASERVEQARATAAPPTTQPDGTTIVDPKILDAANQRLEEGSAVTKLEAKALSADKEFTNARTRLTDAWSKMSGVRAKYQTELRADKDWQAARADVERLSVEMRTPATQPSNRMADEVAGQGQFNTPAGSFSPSPDWWLYGTNMNNAAMNLNRNAAGTPNTGPTNTPRSGGPSANPGPSNKGGGGPTAAPGNSGKTGGGPSADPGNSNKTGGGPSAEPGNTAP